MSALVEALLHLFIRFKGEKHSKKIPFKKQIKIILQDNEMLG